jgi:hypothetical protein
LGMGGGGVGAWERGPWHVPRDTVGV